MPLSTLQVNTTYSLLCTLRTFCCENPGVLDTTAALVQLPPVGDARSLYQVPPPDPAWPVPLFPLNALSLDGDLLRNEHAEYAQNVYVYHLVKAANALATASRKDVGVPRNSVRDISVGYIRGFPTRPFLPERLLQRGTWCGDIQPRIRATSIRCRT